MTLQQDVDVLRKIPLFAKIEPARLKLLAFTSEHVEFRSGEAICRQGDPGDAAYIVLEGSADVFCSGGDFEAAKSPSCATCREPPPWSRPRRSWPCGCPRTASSTSSPSSRRSESR